jgi:hypothetical protein
MSASSQFPGPHFDINVLAIIFLGWVLESDASLFSHEIAQYFYCLLSMLMRYGTEIKIPTRTNVSIC